MIIHKYIKTDQNAFSKLDYQGLYFDIDKEYSLLSLDQGHWLRHQAKVEKNLHQSSNSIIFLRIIFLFINVFKIFKYTAKRFEKKINYL